jgi:8-oxo-dGTP diphosphatase
MRHHVVDVAVSIVQAQDGRVLLAERTARQIAGGFWELPGGKIEPGETPAQAAARELDEEIGIQAHALRPWIAYEHAFRTKTVRLHFFRVDSWTGTPAGKEGQRVAWVNPSAPEVAPVLPSNDRALMALALPPVYVLPQAPGPRAPLSFLERLPALLTQGARMIRLDAPQASPDQRMVLARRAMSLASPYGAQLLLTGSAQEALRAGATGLHSSASALRRLSARPAVKLWGVSCHDQSDLQAACALGADFAVVSPVLSPVLSPSACGARSPVGWEGFQRLAMAAPIPVYAAGGVTADMIDDARGRGGAGVAVTDPIH